MGKRRAYWTVVKRKTTKGKQESPKEGRVLQARPRQHSVVSPDISIIAESRPRLTLQSRRRTQTQKPVKHEPEPEDSQDFDDIPKIVCVVSYSQSKQDSVIMCSICGSKVNQRGIKSSTPSHFYFRQIGLEALCSFDPDIIIEDEGVRCNVCYDCSAIYEDAKQMIKTIKALQASLKSKLSDLEKIVEGSGRSGLNGAPEIVGNFCSDKVNDAKKIRSIQKKLLKAIQQQGNLAQPCTAPANKRGRTDQVKDENARNIKLEGIQESENFNPDIKPYGLRGAKRRKLNVTEECMDDDEEDWQPCSKTKRQYKKRGLKPEQSSYMEDSDHANPATVKHEKQYNTTIPSRKSYCFSGEKFSGIPEWLTTHIEVAEKGIVLRAKIYRYYVDWCLQQKRIPHNQATFGKILRSVFGDKVWSRRLGPRGSSSYCHAGIRFKESSPFNDVQEEYDIEANENSSSKKPRARARKAWQTLGIQIRQKPPTMFPPGFQLPLDYDGKLDIKSFLTGAAYRQQAT